MLQIVCHTIFSVHVDAREQSFAFEKSLMGDESASGDVVRERSSILVHYVTARLVVLQQDFAVVRFEDVHSLMFTR